MNSCFLNPHGYTLDDKEIINGKMVRHLKLDPIPSKRLMYYSDKWDLYFQPNMSLHTDGFSAPALAYHLFPSLKPFGLYKRAGIIHDSSYADKALFASSTLSGPFTRHPMSRIQCDDLLRDMCITLGAWQITANTIWVVVEGAGWQFYGKGDSKHT